jgi:hypothetical protein
VIDPKIADRGLALALHASVGCTTTVWAVPADGARWALVEDSGETELAFDFDGLDGSGQPLPPGAVSVQAEADCEGSPVVAHMDLWVVRLAPLAVDFTGPAEGTGGHVPLAWHKVGWFEPAITPLWEGVAEWSVEGLDGPSGEPSPPPPLWEQTHYPPWGDHAAPEPGAQSYVVPAAYVAGSSPWMVVVPGSTAVDALGVSHGALGDGAVPQVRVVVDGYAADWVPGEPVAIAGTAVPSTLGHHLYTVRWSYEASLDGADFFPVPGEQVTEHPMYLLHGQPTLIDGTSEGMAPAIPWIAALDEISTALQDAPSEPEAVLDGLHAYIHFHEEVVYNPSVRAYTEYEGDYVYWDWIALDLTSWLDHADGPELYCHSTSCLFSVLAGHAGVSAPQFIVGHNFDTHWLLGAGAEEWTNYFFYSHSVVSPDLGLTVWDAAATVDGDGEPWRLPATPFEAVGVPFETYRSLLTNDPIDIVSFNDCFHR